MVRKKKLLANKYNEHNRPIKNFINELDENATYDTFKALHIEYLQKNNGNLE